MGGSGAATDLSTFTDTRALANSSTQENAYANIGIGGTLDNYYRMRVTGTLFVDDAGTANGVVLAAQPELRPLIARSMNPIFVWQQKRPSLVDGACIWNTTSFS